jgi:hypothetical protein
VVLYAAKLAQSPKKVLTKSGFNYLIHEMIKNNQDWSRLKQLQKEITRLMLALSEKYASECCMNSLVVTPIRGCTFQVEQMLSDVRGDITLIREDTHRITSKSIALVELNKTTHLAVASNMTEFFQALKATEAQNHKALEAHKTSFEQYIGEANRSIAAITKAHTQAMSDMQGKLKAASTG